MKEQERLERKFYKTCFTLSREDILDLSKIDGGGLINNIISLIDRDCLGVKLFDDEHGLKADMFYVNNDNTLKETLFVLM